MEGRMESRTVASKCPTGTKNYVMYQMIIYVDRGMKGI